MDWWKTLARGRIAGQVCVFKATQIWLDGMILMIGMAYGIQKVNEDSHYAVPSCDVLPFLMLDVTPNAAYAAKSHDVTEPLHPRCPLYLSIWYCQSFVATDLIWKVAPGNSDVSACTVAFMPMFARAPLMIPQGNQRNCSREMISSPPAQASQ